MLIEDGSDVEAKDKNGNTPLLLASWNGHLPTVQYLIEKAGAKVQAADVNENTSLHVTAFKGYFI
jgi:ankyrin repeat protein